MADTTRRRLALWALPLFFVGIAALLVAFGDRLLPLFKDRQLLREWLAAQGRAGPAVFLLLQILQVVIFILPGEIVQVAGGFAFGFWQGLGLTLAGIAAGSALNYAVGRWLGRPFVQALFPAERLTAMERIVTEKKAAFGYFLLFVIPGLPKDILCYIAGTTRFPILGFLGISMLGRLPGIAGSSFIGSSAFDGRVGLSLAVFAAATLLFVIGLLFRARITGWLTRRFGPRSE
jgi:uncharacterized membrane protein YdjX (TVP38/TMEM64 family)